MPDRPVVLLALPPESDPSPWLGRLREALPDYEVATLADKPDAERVRYAAAWRHPPGSLLGFPRLQAIFSLGAGVDHLMSDPTLPEHVPVVRVVDPDLMNRMSEWVILQVLLHHRQQRMYDYQQFERIWAEDEEQPAARDVRVGIMGLGVLGQDAARKLQMIGFDVAGWSRSPKAVPELKCFAGDAELPAFLAHAQILVVLLPLTPATRGILNGRLFAQLPRDSHFGGPILINAGRGGLQVEADILAALDTGVLRAATLDVFETEPLPSDSELWHHPAVTISPHNSAIAHPSAVIAYIATQIRTHDAGGALANTVGRDAGY